MNQYLLTLVLESGLGESQVKGVLDSVKKKMDNGQVTKEDIWGKRELAYPIKKQTDGYYVHLEFETEPSIVRDLDKSLKVEEDILRYLLVRR